MNPNITKDNQSTFERCSHDRKNPYVMISREMAQDKSISPKAKGVLLYLLSLPSDWKIYHAQLQDGLGVGEDYINSAMDELLENGYAERTREKVKGLFQPYKYIIREFKKCLPDRENQPGSTGPENPAIQSKHSSSYEEEQSKQQQTHVVVVFSCLSDIPIPEPDKIYLSKSFSEEDVKHAISWSQHPNTKLIGPLAAALKWASKVRPFIDIHPEELKNQQRKHAEHLESRIVSSNAKFLALSNRCEIVDSVNTFCFEYGHSEFYIELDKALVKSGFKHKE